MKIKTIRKMEPIKVEIDSQMALLMAAVRAGARRRLNRRAIWIICAKALILAFSATILAVALFLLFEAYMGGLA